MKRLLTAFFLATTVGAQNTASLTFTYHSTDAVLWHRMTQAASMKSLHLHGGDVAWAAYYAGRESAYAEQLIECYDQNGIPLVKPRPE